MRQKQCIHCHGKCIKKGKRKDVQLYRCTVCKKYQQSKYTKRRLKAIDLESIKKLHNEGMGISSIARFMGISKSTVQRKIMQLASKVMNPSIYESGQEYEVDELRTYIGNKRQECWIAYAINRKTKQIVSMVVGRRTKENLSKVIGFLLALEPKRIHTDGLNTYKSLVPKSMHQINPKILSKIERMNLNLRTHLKRLNRKTICYSKSLWMLMACLKIYFWG